MLAGGLWGGLTALIGGGCSTLCLTLLGCRKNIQLRVSTLCAVVFFAGYLAARYVVTYLFAAAIVARRVLNFACSPLHTKLNQLV